MKSLFYSTIRAFCVFFGALMGLFVAIFAIVLLITAVSDSIDTPKKSTLTVSADASGNRKILDDSTPVILRINIHGIIGLNELTETKISDMLYDSREGVLAKDRVKAILLHINTPGGLASDSSAIYRLLKNYKEKYKTPIYAYIEGLCASGGMYIACAADKIYSSHDSIVGSVGVRMGPAFNVSQTMDRFGLQALTLTEGKHKDDLNPFRPWKEGEDITIKEILRKTYEQFVEVVTNARKRLSRDLLINDYGAKIFIAQESEQFGFIDNGNSDYISCLTDLIKVAAIGEGKKYQVLLIAPHHSVIEDLTQGQNALFKGKIEHVFPIAGIPSQLCGKVLFFYQPSFP